MIKSLAGMALAILLLFTSCKKTDLPVQETTELNTASLLPSLVCGARAGSGHPPTTRLAAGSVSGPIVLLIDFNGQQVVNSAWMNPGTITCPAVPASLLSTQARDFILKSVAEDFSGYSVKVTKSEADYNAAPADRRMRCVVTHTMQSTFGYVGGVSIIGSLLWADNTPNFVFCDVLEYNQKYIAGAVSHEFGHAFGLHHQSRYSTNCTMEEEFHSGFGFDALGWAPIMGLSYYQGMITWHNGPNNLGCQQLQNDMDIIGSIAGVKQDDYTALLNNTASLLPSSGVKNGVLENPSDKDAFLKNETSQRRIRITSNGNSDIALEVYNMNGQLAATHDDNASPNINVVVTGRKYLRVKIASNQPYVPAGDSFGGYVISVSNP